MANEQMTQVNSKTLWKGVGKERIDVENPNPSQRPGQVHYQDNKGGKYIYDPINGQFKDAPKKVNDLLKNPEFKKGIEKRIKIFRILKLYNHMNNCLNAKMLKIFINKIILDFKLNDALENLLSEGFIYDNGCYFLKSLRKQQSHVNELSFNDRTGYECFINSIHIDDYVGVNVFEQALLFSDHLISKWNIQDNGLVIKIILSETDFGFNLKFHLSRERENWINENDVDKFEEGLIIFSSVVMGNG